MLVKNSVHFDMLIDMSVHVNMCVDISVHFEMFANEKASPPKGGHTTPLATPQKGGHAADETHVAGLGQATLPKATPP